MCLIDVGKLSEPVTKLMDVCSKGVGKVYEPKHIKKIKEAEAKGIREVAQARADEIDVIAKKIRENPDIPITYSDGHITIDNSNDELFIRMQNRVQFQELKKQQNIENVIAEAYLQLKDEIEVSQEKIDEDWINRFFNSIGEISNKDMQYIWGKILSGEIKKPGTYSIRTIDTLRNITNNEAEIFRKLTSYVIKDTDCGLFIFKEYKMENQYKFAEILLMQDAGLIIPNPDVFLTLNISDNIEESENLQYQDKIILFKSNNGNQEIGFQVYALTNVGKELFLLTEKNYLQGFIKKMAQNIRSEFNADTYYSDKINEENGVIEYKKPPIQIILP